MVVSPVVGPSVVCVSVVGVSVVVTLVVPLSVVTVVVSSPLTMIYPTYS